MPRYQFTLEAIHADWPAYPAGHGAAYALETLCCFPPGTHFRLLDDIDRCLLFLATEFVHGAHASDEYSDRHHHVALWAEDVGRLKADGLLDGFRLRTGDDLREYWIEVAKGAPSPMRDVAIAHAEDYDWETAADDETATIGRATVSPDGLLVAASGWKALSTITASPDVHEFFAHRVSALLRIGYFDSAIREASILLEANLRSRTATTHFGQRLVTHYVAQTSNEGHLGSFQRHLRSELRTFFMFVRNEFAHNIVSLDEGRCYALLRRISAIYEMLDDADSGAMSFQDIILAASSRHETD
jgi:hypothetical protein